VFEKLFRRLTPKPPAPELVLGETRIDQVVVRPADADDPKASAAAHELEAQLRAALEGSHDTAEVKERLKRFEEEHGMTVISEENVVHGPTMEMRRGTPAEVRSQLEELERELEGIDDPDELRRRTEEFAREHGWRVEPERPAGS